MAAEPGSSLAPSAPGQLGLAIPAPDVRTYLEALQRWLDARRAEIDALDAAARASATPDAFTADVMLALSLWQAIRGRTDEILRVWDSGRADTVGRERIAQLIWGRLGAAAGAGLVSMVEASTLCDAIVDRLRERLALDPAAGDDAARLRSVAAAIVRCEDLVSGGGADAERSAALRQRMTRLRDQAARGADITGPLGQLETDVARAERDAIVGAAGRRVLARDRADAVDRVTALAAREPALRDLAARCRREILAPPRLAVPDVARLGPVPEDRAAVDAYRARLDAVGRALDTVEAAYTAPLRERAALRFRLAAGRTKTEANGRDASPTVRAGYAEAQAALEANPCDLALARHLVDQHDYLARDLPGGREGGSS